MRVDIEILGEKVVERRLLRFGERAVAAEPAMAAIGEMILKSETRQFDTEGASGGTPWQDLAPSTVATKARHAGAYRILQETGVLFDSLTSKGATGNIFEVGPDHLRLGTDVPYATFHQTGTSRMPARPPVKLNELDRQGAVKLLQRWLVHGVV